MLMSPNFGLRFVMLASLAITAAPSAVRAQAASTPPAVQTSHGPIEGMQRECADVFLGIPYALPPVGERRLALPVETASWTKPTW